MASLMEDLITILEGENLEYQTLLDLSMRKTPIIIAGDLKKLGEITDEEQEIVGRINQLEQKRDTTINDIANVINKDVDQLKIMNLIQMLENRPAEQQKLAVIHDKLRDTMENMVHINEQNKTLIQNSLELVEFDLNYVKAMQTAPETANYNKGACTSGEALGVGRGRFDAKQ